MSLELLHGINGRKPLPVHTYHYPTACNIRAEVAIIIVLTVVHLMAAIVVQMVFRCSGADLAIGGVAPILL